MQIPAAVGSTSLKGASGLPGGLHAQFWMELSRERSSSGKGFPQIPEDFKVLPVGDSWTSELSSELKSAGESIADLILRFRHPGP